MGTPALFDVGDPVAIDDRPVGQRGAPVTIRHVRDHAFVPRDTRGCGECGKARHAMVHRGTPQSLNALGSPGGGSFRTYQGWKKHWSERLHELLVEAELPKPLAHVHAEGLICFPTRTERDQGNFRVILEKALGDVLVEGGWLLDDSWSYYEFGNLRRTYARGEAWTEVTIVPTLPLPG